MESLGIDFKLIIVQIINFGLLLFLLKRFLYKPILKILDERRKRIAESLVSAQKIEEEWAKLEEEKEKEFQNAKEAARQLVEEAKSQGEKERAGIVKHAREEVERMSVRMREQLAQEREKIRSELKAEVADLVILMVQKLLKEKISKEKQEEFLAESLEELKKKIVPTALLFEPLSLKRSKVSPESEKISQGILNLLRKTDNLKILPQILERLEGALLTSGEVLTSQPLEEKEQARIISTLEKIFGKNLKLQFRVSPKILGGMVVKVGDQVFDSSLLGKAKQLRESL